MSSPLSPTQQLQEKLLLRDDEKISAEARSVVEELRKEIEALRLMKAAAEARDLEVKSYNTRAPIAPPHPTPSPRRRCSPRTGLRASTNMLRPSNRSRRR